MARSMALRSQMRYGTKPLSKSVKKPGALIGKLASKGKAKSMGAMLGGKC